MTVLQASAVDQIVAFAINGLATLLLLALTAFARTAVKTLKSAHDKLDHLDECMDGVKKEAQEDREAYRRHRAEAEERDKHIALLEKNYAGLEGWVKGRAGLAIDTPITEIRALETKPADPMGTEA